MAPLYDPTGNPMLGGAALTLDPTSLAVLAEVAEGDLGLKAPAFTDPNQVLRAKTAVAIQVTFVMQRGVGPDLYVSQSRGARAGSYVSGAPVVSKLALSVASRLNRDNARPTVDMDALDWQTVRSRRPDPNWPTPGLPWTPHDIIP